jgi:hypothetical protein
MTDSAARRRQQRIDFLIRLYERVDASVSEFVAAFELGDDMGLPRDETRKIFEYLAEKGWVKVDDFREGTVRLTAAGIDRVEAPATD